MEELIKKITQFRDERDWKQFHSPKNLATAISIESSELNEIFLWKKEKESFEADKSRVADEIADVMIYSILMMDTFNLDLFEIINNKISKNAIKYPISKSKGLSKKYTEL